MIFSPYPVVTQSSSSRMRVMNHNWSAMKQRIHPQNVAEISHHSILSGGRDSTVWNIVWVSPQGHRSVSVSRHFLSQAPHLLTDDCLNKHSVLCSIDTFYTDIVTRRRRRRRRHRVVVEDRSVAPV